MIVLQRNQMTFLKSQQAALFFIHTYIHIYTCCSFPGNLSEQELYACLKKLPSLKDLSRAECQRLFDAIDGDRSGDLTRPILSTS